MKKSICEHLLHCRQLPCSVQARPFSLPRPAAAQDYTSGAIIGTVTDHIRRSGCRCDRHPALAAQNQARTFVTNGQATSRLPV